MPSFVAILHSSHGFYSDELVENALCCLSAISQSTLTAAPDFIPTMAVQLADPVRGARYIYSSAIPDRNHSLDGVSSTYPILTAPSLIGTAETEECAALAQLFRFRSPMVFHQIVLGAVQTANNTFCHDDRAADAKPVHDAADQGKGWMSLSGALLAALCFLHQHASHSLSCGVELGGEEGDDAADSTGGAGASAGARGGSGCILVFTDDKVVSPLGYSTECAISTVTMMASKMGVTISCFGSATVHVGGATSLSTAPTNHFMAMSASVGGMCAARFSYQHLGILLDSCSAAKWCNTARQRRNMVASQYVVSPAMLDLDLQGSRYLSGESAPSQKVASPPSPFASKISKLGWLCPECMGIFNRNLRDSGSAASGMTTDGEKDDSERETTLVGPPCPCCVIEEQCTQRGRDD